MDSDLSTTYLGAMIMKGQGKLKNKHKCTNTEDSYIHVEMLAATDYNLLLDTGPNKSFMFKSFYEKCPTIQSLPKFSSNMRNILVGNS